MSIAVIGCGAVVRRLHAPVLANLQKEGVVTVVAVADPDESQAKAAAAMLNEALTFGELTFALDVTRPDIVLVASPAGLHEEHILHALSLGCHVLSEKPLAPSATSTLAISKAAKMSGKVVAVGMTRRFNPALAEAKKIVASWDAPVTFQYREGSLYGWPLASDAAFRRQAGGGGVLMDKGVHVLDSLQWIFGKLKVREAWDDAQMGGVEGTALLKLEGAGSLGDVLLSWDHNCRNGIWVSGPREQMFLDPAEYRFVELRSSSGTWQRRQATAAWPCSPSDRESQLETPAGYSDSIRLQWIAMVRAVRFGEPMPAGPDAAASVIEEIECAYSVSKPLQEPWLSDSERLISCRSHWRTQNAR